MNPPAVTLQWLTPAETRRPSLPRWVQWATGVALGVCIVGTIGRLDSLATAGGLGAAACAVRIGWWFEEAIYGALGEQRARVKILVFLTLALFGWVGLIAVAVLGLLPFGFGTFFKAFGGTFVWWFTAASAGTACLVIIDATVSRGGARFRTRLSLAILSLVGGALLISLVASVLSTELVSTLAHGSGSLRTEAGFGLTAEEVSKLIAEHPAAVSLGVFVLIFSALLPAVVSACTKLADAAMERLRPMTRAFSLVSGGERGVRVEEKGSTEFIDLASSFNRLVETLSASERMERAFGRYVSGQVLSRIKAQHGEAELPAESRVATVFFADIRGFTSLSERLTPEQVVTFLNRYLARVVARIDAHVGYLNKFIGDAVVVVFNGPVDQPDHAERAVRCALALQEEVAKLNAEGALPEVGELRIGVGVATGPMVCGNVGGPTQMEYTVIGDTVNLSARLTSLAGPGEVWVSEATAKAAATLRFSPLPEVKVKGKEKPVLPFKAEA